MSDPVPPRLFSFIGGLQGKWKVTEVRTVTGESLPVTPRLDIVAGEAVVLPSDAKWLLRGIISNERYVTRAEKVALVAKQEGLGRPGSTMAALIPLRKTAAWWAMTQDERREIFEARSRHIAIGMEYLPAIARRLHHCRDLGISGAFDFLTWFEFAPADEPLFEKLLEQLRATPEWEFIDREVDVRLRLDDETL